MLLNLQKVKGLTSYGSSCPASHRKSLAIVLYIPSNEAFNHPYRESSEFFVSEPEHYVIEAYLLYARTHRSETLNQAIVDVVIHSSLYPLLL